MNIVSATGHRPDKLPDKQTGYKLPNPCYNYICQEGEKILLELKPDKVLTGMALGWDSYIANICIKLNIPFVACVPFLDQEKMWPKASQNIYNKLLSKASEIIVVSDGGYSPHKMQIRNEYMVDHSDIVLACFDGSSGGTKNCIDYAKSKSKEIIIINPLNYIKE